MLIDFDLAFLNKIKDYYSNTIYANTALVYNVAYNLAEDPKLKLAFPLISIYRPTGFELVTAQNFAARKRGLEYYFDGTEGTANMARFITVNLVYQLDIYAKSPESLDNITEEIMQALNLDSTLEVKQLDDAVEQYFTDNYDITHNNGPVEQSEFQNGDRVYHYSLAYQIENARLINFKDAKLVTDIDFTVDTDLGV